MITQQLSDLALLGLHGRVFRQGARVSAAFTSLSAETLHVVFIAVVQCSQY